PETLVRWHHAGFRRYWRRKSRSPGGRPQLETNLRALIRRMSIENPLWGAPRIHGELLKLGVELAQSSVAKSMVKRRGTPSQGSRSDLRYRCHTPIAGHGHPRQADCTSLTLAERFCRTADWIHPARVFGPHHCLRRGTPAPDSEILRRLLQRRQNAPVLEQGC